MDFIKHSDIGIFDWLDNWVNLGIFAILVIICVAIFIFVIKGTEPAGVFFMLVGLTFPMLGFMLGFVNEVKIAQEENISKVFNVSDDQQYEQVSTTESGKFSDVTTIIKNVDEQVMREVTFGFKESGEPFIYENGEVNKDFITSLKK